VSGLGEHPKNWDPDPLLISATVETNNFTFGNWYTIWVWGIAYQETTFRSKTGGGIG